MAVSEHYRRATEPTYKVERLNGGEFTVRWTRPDGVTGLQCGSSGDIRVWKSYSGARAHIRRATEGVRV